MGIEKALTGGLLGAAPAMAGKMLGKENAGFGLGLIPGMLYKNQYKKREEKKGMTPQTTNTATDAEPGMKKGGKVKKMASGGSASKRADGCAMRGKTRGKMV